MKYNRIGMLIVLALSASLLCGCMDVKDLSEEQEDMIAEYAGGVLLRYSDKYALRLITAEQKAKEDAPQNAETTASPTPEPEPADSGLPEQTSDVAQDSTDVSAAPEVEPEPEVSLNEVFKVEGVDFSYDSYRFCKQYPEKADGDIIPVTAQEDETLLVVSFTIRNQSGKKKHIQLGKRNIQYNLKIDGGEFQPDISILDNMGLNYLDATIKKNGSEKAVLIYRLSKERESASGISLSVEDGDLSSEIQLR